MTELQQTIQGKAVPAVEQPGKTLSAEQAPLKAKPAEDTKKQKPVYAGRITLGVALVAIGLLITASLFLPGVDLLTVAKFAPLILVLLGTEILAASIRHGDRNVKVGFGLTLICLVLIAGSVGAAALPQIWQEYGPGYAVQQEKVQREYEKQFYSKINSMQVEQLQFSLDHSNQIAYATMAFADEFETKEEFAAAALPVVKALAQLETENAFLFAEDGKQELSLDLKAVYSLGNVTREELVKSTRVLAFDENG